jgi:hypothetical protein
MAFTVTMLAWGAIDFADDVQAAGEWGHTLEAIKWGTDYFVKAHTQPFVYWAEVCSCRCPAPPSSILYYLYLHQLRRLFFCSHRFHKPTDHPWSGVETTRKKKWELHWRRGGGILQE